MSKAFVSSHSFHADADFCYKAAAFSAAAIDHPSFWRCVQKLFAAATQVSPAVMRMRRNILIPLIGWMDQRRSAGGDSAFRRPYRPLSATSSPARVDSKPPSRALPGKSSDEREIGVSKVTGKN
uniref:Uncharacterized protein n=1 Tax=Sphaerodactylus townsendi TaxID=933632 RepID=A0ACB8FD55_9SAUR